jgi:uncharacterized protein YccT (UPF0319 family)
MKLFLLTVTIGVLSSCGTGVVKMTDRFEDHAIVTVPSHIEALEVGGRRVKTGFSFGDETILEIPLGRTELVFRFYRIYDINEDDHEKLISDKMTAVFIADKNNHYEIHMQNPESFSKAKQVLGKIKGYVLHKESGARINATPGVIEERYHGIQIKKPYEELKYWWQKATPKEKLNFKSWIEAQ